jgi:hypothetical protein
MKAAILTCFVATLVMQIVTPFWWWVMLVPCVYFLSKSRDGARPFLSGAISGGLLWTAGALYYWLTGGSPLIDRLSSITNPWLLVVATGVIGLLAGGFGAATGYAVRRAFSPKKEPAAYKR